MSLLYLIIDGIALPPGPSNLHYTELQLALLYLVLVLHVSVTPVSARSILTILLYTIGLNCLHCYIPMQSLIVPLQGFFNAIVYGWTREDFVNLVAIDNSHFDGWDLDGSLIEEKRDDYKSLNSSITKCDDSNITLSLDEPN